MSDLRECRSAQVPYAKAWCERGTYRPEVRAWQARMAERGWTTGVDGFYGPQSTGFAAEKGLSTARRGDLNRSVFTGAWTLRVT